jgi:hypothetical protein
MSEQLLDKARPEIEELARSCPAYLEPAIQDIWDGSGEGWVGDWAYEAVATANTKHEVALHGATHVPWDSPCMNVDLARRELGLLSRVDAPIARDLRTYVFPRNAVAHTSVLAEFGIEGYRDSRSFGSRAMSLLSELNLLARPDCETPMDLQLIRIPAGYFINWRHGPRRIIPIWLSALRARLMLERATECNGIVHYWTHPENIASAPDTLSVLREILMHAAKLRDAGTLEVLTQEQYCSDIGSDQKSGMV